MSAAERWERAAQRPDPKTIAQLTRPQLASRIQLLRDVRVRLLVGLDKPIRTPGQNG